MRRQIIIIMLLSALVLLFTGATVSYLANDVVNTKGLNNKNETCATTTETLWEVITRQIIGAVSLHR